ncbi:hypothetical protein AGMMS49975_16820 [Clostridia bacterium]|nr:hypothetical protein AGMMS49975_16820 [Clostridia bacterium]
MTLILEISENLSIPKESSESAEEWHRRVLYSLVGCHMIAALYDFDDDIAEAENLEHEVSMQHILKCGNNLILNINEIDCKKIREIYTLTGYMLHKNNRLAYPKSTISTDSGISFIRGVPPWEKVNVSGLGMYYAHGNQSTLFSIEQMFGLEELDINDWFVRFSQKIRWETIDSFPTEKEYLNLTESPQNGYWQSNPPKSELILCRSKENTHKEYSILRSLNKIQKSDLSDWQVEKGEYRRIAIALRIANGISPILRVKQKINTMELITDYLLPPAEQNFFELYSWNIEGSPWHRIISVSLYPTFKRIFQKLGYRIIEENSEWKQ